jgi:hydrogenase expression/formation protein HypE
VVMLTSASRYGKLPREFFERVIYRNLGSRRNEVLVGPSPGVDTSVVKIATNEVLVSTTDPISFIPELGPGDSAWLSVNVIASDLVTSGFRPQYAIFDLNLPPSIQDDELEKYWKAIGHECERLGISILGGHSGRFEGLNYTIVGAGTMFSIGSSNSYLTSKDGSIGDRIIVTKSAAIASTGILSRVFPNTISAKFGDALMERAQGYFNKISVVEDALTAVKAGVREQGVSAMHDVTEGGVLSAIFELATASSLGARIDLDRIPISDESRKICDLFEIDPLISLGEGSLVISCNPTKSGEVVSLLEGVGATDVGVLVAPEKGIKTVNQKGLETSIKHTAVDPYWQAYYTAKKNNWT